MDAWLAESSSGRPVDEWLVELVEAFRAALVRRLDGSEYELLDVELELRRRLRDRVRASAGAHTDLKLQRSRVHPRDGGDG